jgi:hypothetical protein
MTTPSLFTHNPSMNRRDVEKALNVSEHGVTLLRKEGRLSPVKIGGRLIYPRWQVAAILGLVDPDVAAAEGARQAASKALHVGATPVVASAVRSRDSMRSPEEAAS